MSAAHVFHNVLTDSLAGSLAVATSVRHYHGFYYSLIHFFFLCLLCESTAHKKLMVISFSTNKATEHVCIFDYLEVARFRYASLVTSRLLCVPLSPRTAIGAGVVFRYSETRSIATVSFVSEVRVEHPVECRCCVLYPGIESTHFSSLAACEFCVD